MLKSLMDLEFRRNYDGVEAMAKVDDGLIVSVGMLADHDEYTWTVQAFKEIAENRWAPLRLRCFGNELEWNGASLREVDSMQQLAQAELISRYDLGRTAAEDGWKSF